MPLPLLLVPIAVTVGSAAVQAVGKLRARKELNSLRAQLADAQTRHRLLLTEYYLRQHFLCRQLGLEPPSKPESLLLPEPGDGEEVVRIPLWKKLIPLKPPTTLTRGSTGSARHIVGRHSFSAVSGVIWRISSSNVMRVAQPVGARIIQPVGARLVTIAPRFIGLGGGAASTGGSIAASTAARTAIASFSVVGIVLGPAIAAWTVTSEIRKIKRARRELARLLARQDMELAGFRVRNRRLEAQYAETLETPADQRELVSVTP
jgi:hypothetical protein